MQELLILSILVLLVFLYYVIMYVVPTHTSITRLEKENKDLKTELNHLSKAYNNHLKRSKSSKYHIDLYA